MISLCSVVKKTSCEFIDYGVLLFSGEKNYHACFVANGGRHLGQKIHLFELIIFYLLKNIFFLTICNIEVMVKKGLQVVDKNRR